VHSAEVLLMAFTGFLWLADLRWAFVALLGLRLVLFFAIKLNPMANRTLYWVVFRVLGVILASLMALFSGLELWVLVPWLVAEILDRVDFYNQLTKK
jgi:hypothetical protein